MRHLKAGRKLNRNASHRLALKRNLAMALFRHERIITTEAKAKELRPFVEKLITLAKKGTLHARRQAIAWLGPTRNAEVKPVEKEDEEGDDRTIIQKLFNEIGPRFRNRPGGYTRVIKRHERRLGDAGKTAFIELLKENEQKVRAKAKPTAAPAPRLEARPTPRAETPPAPPAEPPAPAPAPETPPETPPSA